MKELTLEQLKMLIDELNFPVDSLGKATTLLCLATSLGSGGCKNCPVVLFNYDTRTEYEKCSLHEPCQRNLYNWIKDKSLVEFLDKFNSIPN